MSAMTLGQLVDVAAEQWPKREAFVSLYQGHRYTFAELREKVRGRLFRPESLLFKSLCQKVLYMRRKKYLANTLGVPAFNPLKKKRICFI
jgi:hypothetical protein